MESPSVCLTLWPSAALNMSCGSVPFDRLELPTERTNGSPGRPPERLLSLYVG